MMITIKRTGPSGLLNADVTPDTAWPAAWPAATVVLATLDTAYASAERPAPTAPA